ncbi:MAG: PQQ-binding-like beta-propeller repeat protein [Gemmataceae bacterium]|nr:PQQ-binding-like beta-propeller repeat protein [Gemmataceae bacterium]
MKSHLPALALLASLVVSAHCFAGDPPDAGVRWTGWLGPNRDGWVSYFKPPAKWPKELKQVWRVEVGTGYGSPLVADGRVYQHARQGDDEVVWCLDLKTGAVKWRQSYPTPFKEGGGAEYHGKGPKSSPSLAGGRLFTISVTGILTAWDAASGKRLWQFDSSDRFKKSHPRWGAAMSPIVDGDRVIAHFGTDRRGALIALDAATGKEVWRQGDFGPSYSSPLVVEIHGVRQVIDWNERTLAGVDAKSGRKLWNVSAPGDFIDQNMPTPVFHDGRVLLGAENRGIRCLVPRLENGEWDVDEPWHQTKAALNMSTAVMNGGLLYGFSHYGKGRFFCLDPKTGDILWEGPERTGDNVMFLSIPGHVVALVNDGMLRIIAASGAGYREVASYRVAEDRTWAPPVLLDRGILVKDLEHLTRWSLAE